MPIPFWGNGIDAANRAEGQNMAIRHRAEAGHPDGEAWAGTRVLMIELPPEMVAALSALEEAQTVAASFDKVDIDFVARHDPQYVLAPLVGAKFDILDVSARLLRCGYTGALRALTTPLPNLAAVRSELRSHCHGLDVDVIVLSPPAETGH